MHGLINRSVQCFIRDTYSQELWEGVARRAKLETPDFEAMLEYDDAVTQAVIDAIAAELGVPRRTVLEDVGTYLVSHPNVEALRRLLRFSGVTFLEFLHSLDDLKARAKLALSDLELPDLTLHDHGEGAYHLECKHKSPGFSFVVMGVLRTMADDYGALVLLEHTDTQIIQIQVIQEGYSAGREFELGVKSA